MVLKKGILKSFSSGDYTAVVQLGGNQKAYLEGITVARHIPSGEMIPGRKVALLFFDDYHPKEAVVIAIYV